MKEVIAKTNKNVYKTMFVLSLVSVFGTANLFRIQAFRIFAIPCLVMLAICTLLSLFMLIDPRPAIVCDQDKLIIRQGLFIQKQVLIKNISNVYLTKYTNKDQIIENSISIKVTDKTNEKILVCSVVNAEETVKKIKDLRSSIFAK